MAVAAQSVIGVVDTLGAEFEIIVGDAVVVVHHRVLLLFELAQQKRAQRLVYEFFVFAAAPHVGHQLLMLRPSGLLVGDLRAQVFELVPEAGGYGADGGDEEAGDDAGDDVVSHVAPL